MASLAGPPVVLAHTGHWAIDLGTYLGPLVVVLALLKLSDRRQQRRRAAGQDEPPA